MKSYKQLQEERAAKVLASQSLITLAEVETREFNDAETTQFDALGVEIRNLDGAIARAKQVEETRAIAAGGSSDAVRHTSAKEDRDLSRFSYLRAIDARLSGRPLDGIEGEMHSEGLKEYRDAGLQPEGNLIIPQMVMKAGFTDQRRAMTAVGQTVNPGDQGGLSIQTNVGSVIERLYAALVTKGMGATILDGLVGNVQFPKFRANDAAAVKSEVGAANLSSPTLDKITLSPQRVPVAVQYSRQLLAQTSLSVEAMLRNDMAYQLAALIDAAGIAKILSNPSVANIASGGANGLAPALLTIVGMETAVAIQNAADGQLGYLVNPSTRGKLKTTQKFGGSATGAPLWDQGDTPLNGYRAGVSTQITNAGIKGTGTGLSSAIFGNFSDLLYGQWGGVEMLVNPYTYSSTGLVQIDAWTFFDTQVRRAESFAILTDIATV